MKKYLLGLFILVYCTCSYAQIKRVSGQITRRFVLNEQTIVKDTSGARLSYKDWQSLVATGKYSLKRENPADSTTYILYTLTPEQKERLMTKMPPPNESGFFTNGEKIESFRAYDMNSKRVELKDMLGKVIVLNFWFINCPPCRREIPELNKLVDEYANNPNVVFVAVGLDSRSEIREFIRNIPYNYRQVANGREYAAIYGLHLYPTNVVIDKTGIVRFNASGFAMNTPFWIKKTIDECIADKQ
ncbi:TlpA family protein disulfide reductase [Mucilaginibacter segetis]|uniref:TlpA family protein disulfide reductase n=1 Tax=Mucilaginibacter segetis TaxID=2793071 RepID=A0A934PPV6_9SPHI|nr:TlpA disulfide reductase family protein [Mucilaginibacter segetis]MBK0377894.1 TlpA family protein disulfide reductase [Mucilaginibacter segetis]